MQQVRVGGRYDESREQRLWAALLGLIAEDALIAPRLGGKFSKRTVA